MADRRAELDLQISLLAEHELTRLIELMDAIPRKVGVTERPADLEETKQDVDPERVVEEIERSEARRAVGGGAVSGGGTRGFRRFPNRPAAR